MKEVTMVLIPVRCPHCQSAAVIKGGKTKAGIQRYKCLNVNCPYYSFQLDLIYKGRYPAIKEQIVDMALNGSGIRDTARVLKISPTTVLNELKKTMVAKSAGVSSSQAWRDMILDHGKSADAGFVADGASRGPAAALARH
jgi:transposase-like protein